MKRIWKQLISCLVMVGLVWSMAVEPVYAISIYYQNKLIETDVEPVIENGRTLVPVAVIGKAMGATSTWDPLTKKVTITRGDLKLHLTLGQEEYVIEEPDGVYPELLDVPATSINGRTMVPLSAIAVAFGAPVQWDASTKSVLIGSVPEKPQKESVASPDDSPELLDIEKLILQAAKGIPGIDQESLNVSRLIFSQLNNDDFFREIGLIRERKPGHYRVYSVVDRNDDEYGGDIFMVNTDTKEVFQLLGGIYSIPDFSVAVPLSFEEHGAVEELLQAVMLQKGIIQGGDQVNYELGIRSVPYEGPRNIWEAHPERMFAPAEEKYLGSYAINGRSRTITDLDTGTVIYDDSRVMNYPKKKITRDNVGEETLKILQKLKIIKDTDGYIFSEIRSRGKGDEIDGREGFGLTVSHIPETSKVATILGQYFMNLDGNVLMEKNQTWDQYYYIYGSVSPKR